MDNSFVRFVPIVIYMGAAFVIVSRRCEAWSLDCCFCFFDCSCCIWWYPSCGLVVLDGDDDDDDIIMMLLEIKEMRHRELVVFTSPLCTCTYTCCFDDGRTNPSTTECEWRDLESDDDNDGNVTCSTSTSKTAAATMATATAKAMTTTTIQEKYWSKNTPTLVVLTWSISSIYTIQNLYFSPGSANSNFSIEWMIWCLRWWLCQKYWKFKKERKRKKS